MNYVHSQTPLDLEPRRVEAITARTGMDVKDIIPHISISTHHSASGDTPDSEHAWVVEVCVEVCVLAVVVHLIQRCLVRVRGRGSPANSSPRYRLRYRRPDSRMSAMIRCVCESGCEHRVLRELQFSRATPTATHAASAIGPNGQCSARATSCVSTRQQCVQVWRCHRDDTPRVHSSTEVDYLHLDYYACSGCGQSNWLVLLWVMRRAVRNLELPEIDPASSALHHPQCHSTIRDKYGKSWASKSRFLVGSPTPAPGILGA